MEQVLLDKIKAFSGADNNTEEIFDLNEERLDFYIEEYYKSMVSFIKNKYNIPHKMPADVEQILIELTSNLIRSHATRQSLAVTDHENFDFDEAVNNIFTEDIEKRLQHYKKKSHLNIFRI